MKEIEFSREEKEAIIGEIQDFFSEEHELELGNIPAEMVLNFFTEKVGGYFYNRGLNDARAQLANRIEDFNDDIYAMEKPEFSVR